MSQDISTTEPFDWISARAECTPERIFQKLRLQIEDDVNKRKSIMTENERARFVFSLTSEGRRLSVEVDGQDQLFKGVIISVTPTGIAIQDGKSGSLIHEGILTLSNDGECRLKVGDTEYNLWQFRKLALEEVLFTSVAKWRP